MSKGCPHKNIVFCPLYHAMHFANAPSCDDGDIASGSCGVARKMKYERLVEELRIHSPGIVEELQFKEEAEERKAQRRRNMRAAGLLH